MKVTESLQTQIDYAMNNSKIGYEQRVYTVEDEELFVVNPAMVRIPVLRYERRLRSLLQLFAVDGGMAPPAIQIGNCFGVDTGYNTISALEDHLDTVNCKIPKDGDLSGVHGSKEIIANAGKQPVLLILGLSDYINYEEKNPTFDANTCEAVKLDPGRAVIIGKNVLHYNPRGPEVNTWICLMSGVNTPLPPELLTRQQEFDPTITHNMKRLFIKDPKDIVADTAGRITNYQDNKYLVK